MDNNKKMSGWTRPSLILALATFVVHLLVNGRYGIFRDELYFIVCGNHPAWGYVDQPPLVPLLASWAHLLFGMFLAGFRLVPALAMSATVALTAEFARVAGGGRYAQWLAGLCVLCASQFLAIGLLFTTDTFQPITWLACAWFLVRLEQTGDERWWIPFGAVVGVSLLSKYMIAFFLASLAVGLLATPLRRSLARPWIYLGILIAAVLVLPNAMWQRANGWPFLELGKAAVNGKNVALSPQGLLAQQLLLMGPLTAPVWIAGLWAGIRRPKLAVYRAFPIAWVLLCIIFIVAHGKAYYVTPIYPILLGIGAVAMESRFKRAAWRGLMVGAVTAFGLIAAPLAIPVLPEETYISYAAALGVSPSAAAGEKLKPGRLPQHFADMHGWPEMAARIAAVYNALPPADRVKAVFFGGNYGEAAAVDLFGPPLGLPPAISGHNNYFLWGPRGHDGSVMIVIGGDPADYAKVFTAVEKAGFIDSPYAMPYETDKPIYVLRGLKTPLAAAWPQVKHYE
jgi:hypothetical protein